MFDQAGPQIYFANSRDEAVREVERANEIARLHPSTVSMRHLREMDAAWRIANGLPRLPEPEGRTVVITAEPRTAGAPADRPVPTGRIGVVLETAARVAERESLRQRVDDSRNVLKQTRALDRELVRVWAACETSIASLRGALAGIFDGESRVVERELRDLLRAVEPGGASACRAAAERFLARRAPAAHPDSSAPANAVAASAPPVAAWDKAAEAAVGRTGAQLRPGLTDRARYHALLAELARMRAAGERSLADARSAYSAAAAGPGPRDLREQWRGLSAADRRAVLQLLPQATELMRPGAARSKEGRSRGKGGMTR